MTEKGMTFTGESIRAMLEGRKTVTRRLAGLEKINDMPDLWRDPFFCEDTVYWNFWQRYTGDVLSAKPCYQVGDLVYARETWALGGLHQPLYRATDENEMLVKHGKWKSAMFMFKKYARIWRKIVGARPERLQEISWDDIKAEGIECIRPIATQWDMRQFQALWDSTNPKHPWDRNEWVWRYEMKEIKEVHAACGED